MTTTRKLIVLQFILLFMPSECERKSKRAKDEKLSMPKYDVYPSDNLPNDRQITTFLYKGTGKIFFYQSSASNGALSITVITCSSPVQWTMIFSKENNTASTPALNESFEGTITADMTTQHLVVDRGLYVLQFVALEAHTYAHVYISTENGGPQALQTNNQMNKLRIPRRPRRKRTTVRWNPSPVDPQGTDYCLVISNRKHYNTLCSAQSKRYGVVPPHQHNGESTLAESQTVLPFEPTLPANRKFDPLIVCVSKQTQYTILDLKQGQNYYLDLFASNHQSNLTYPYGSRTIMFSKHIKPISLKDGKSMMVNLKKYDGKVVLRFKVGKKLVAKTLDLFIIPCSGAVDVEVSLKDEIIIAKRRIEGFGDISLTNPITAGRYYIKIIASNHEELQKISGVEIYATTKSFARIPVPKMPRELAVKEYTTLRRCDSVTVGWLAAASIQSYAHYCLVVKEGRIHETDEYKMPNQCGLENRLRKSADFVVKSCKDIYHHDKNVILEKISQLKPGRSYIVQVTVKKPKGKTLSYDLLQVYTKPYCHHHNNKHGDV